MESDKFSIKVFFDNREFSFDTGDQAYIFHTGIYNDIHKKYGIEDLLHYTNLVHACYLKDEVDCPFGKLADYVAEHWEQLKEENPRNILYDFYNQKL